MQGGNGISDGLYAATAILFLFPFGGGRLGWGSFGGMQKTKFIGAVGPRFPAGQERENY